MGPASATHYRQTNKQPNKKSACTRRDPSALFSPLYFLFINSERKETTCMLHFYPAFRSRAAAAGLEKEPLSPKAGGLRHKMDYYPFRTKLQVSLTKLFVAGTRRLVTRGR